MCRLFFVMLMFTGSYMGSRRAQSVQPHKDTKFAKEVGPHAMLRF
jgi:hypothetical protein